MSQEKGTVMAAFNYAVKTKKSIERGENYYTVIAHGTKKQMLEYAEKLDAHPETVASKVTREKDGEVVHSYKREGKQEEPRERAAQ
jgi:hypothetical protein